MPAMSAALPDVDGLLARQDALSYSERLRDAATLARVHASDPRLAARIDELLARGTHEGILAVTMATAVRAGAPLQAALGHRSLIVRRLAITAAVRSKAVPEDSLAQLALALPSGLRRALLKALAAHGRRAVGRALFPEVLARFGPRDAAVLLPVLEDSQVRAHLPAMGHAVGSWRRLVLHHLPAVLAHLEARLAAAAPREQPAVWSEHAGLIVALAQLRAAALLDLLDRFGDGCPPHLLWSRLGELARADPERTVAQLERPRLRDLAMRQGLPRRLLNQLVRFTPAQRVRLGRVVAERPELLAPLLRTVAPGQREALIAGVHGDQELALRVWPDVFLDSLPRALQRREAARMLELAVVKADPDRVQALTAYLDPATALPRLGPALRAADAELRARAVARTIACAGREGSMSAALALISPRLKNDQDPVRLQAFHALSKVPPLAFVAADAPLLIALATAATEARDTSYATRVHIQQLGFRLLRSHATDTGDVLFKTSLELLRLLAGQTQTLALPDLSRGLPRRSAPAIVAALAPIIAAANERERPELVLGLATALGRRGHDLQKLTDLLQPLVHAKPDSVATRAIGLLLAAPRGRDERVRELLEWDRSVITLHPVLMHLHRRRQAWLDPFLDGKPISGRFRTGRTVLLLGLASGFVRWLPRQQRAFIRLLERAATDRGQAHVARATVIARLARLPVVGVDELTPHLASPEVPIVEATLAALAWIDSPAEALPILLTHLDGDRARIAMYALPRVARFVDGRVLATALLDLITGRGRKVTVRKEALRLLGEHRSGASVPALQAALAAPGLHKDVAIAIGHAARSLLDDPRALELLAALARSPEPDIARSLLDPRPELLPAPVRPGYAALVLRLAAHPDLATRRAAIVALPAWSSGQEAATSDLLAATVLDLDTGDAWPEATAALVTIAGDGRATAALVRVAADLAARARQPGPPDRDLPAYQRLLALCEQLRAIEPTRRLALRADLAAVADALAPRDELWPLAAALRICAIDCARVDEAAAALRELAADARADVFLGELVTCLSRQLSESAARYETAELLALADALTGGPPPAARLAVAVVLAAGQRSAWNDRARAQLQALREHRDLRVRHAAQQVFSRPEAPSLADAS